MIETASKGGAFWPLLSHFALFFPSFLLLFSLGGRMDNFPREKCLLIWLSLIFIAGCMLVAQADAACDTPATSNTICYRGYLADFSGTPSATRTITFTIYDAPTGGVQKWQETLASITITFGRFAVELGTGTPFSADFHSYVLPRWLGIWITGEASERTPREDFTTAPSALRAKYSESVESVPVSRITGTITYATTAGSALSVPASGITGTVSYATTAGSALSVPVSGIVGTVPYATAAGSAASVPAAGIVGTVSYATAAGSVPASGITGTVAYASTAGSANVASSVPDDSITSAKIGEADGSADQNTNTGLGIKTGHLKNGAVTSDKIALHTIKASNLADASVSGSKLNDIGWVTYDCGLAGCSGVTLGTVCDSFRSNSRPTSVSCSKIASGTAWKGILTRTTRLGALCAKVDGPDAIVICQDTRETVCAICHFTPRK